jgi:hypothetical protein
MGAQGKILMIAWAEWMIRLEPLPEDARYIVPATAVGRDARVVCRIRPMSSSRLPRAPTRNRDSHECQRRNQVPAEHQR